MYRQGEAETGTAVTGQQGYLSPVMAGNAAHYGQPEAAAAGAAITALVQPDKRLEDLRGQLRIDTGPVIAHLQQVTILPARDGEDDPVLGIAQGIADEILHGTGQQPLIAAPGHVDG